MPVDHWTPLARDIRKARIAGDAVRCRELGEVARALGYMGLANTALTSAETLELSANALCPTCGQPRPQAEADDEYVEDEDGELARERQLDAWASEQAERDAREGDW